MTIRWVNGCNNLVRIRLKGQRVQNVHTDDNVFGSEGISYLQLNPVNPLLEETAQ